LGNAFFFHRKGAAILHLNLTLRVRCYEITPFSRSGPSGYFLLLLVSGFFCGPLDPHTDQARGVMPQHLFPGATERGARHLLILTLCERRLQIRLLSKLGSSGCLLFHLPFLRVAFFCSTGRTPNLSLLTHLKAQVTHIRSPTAVLVISSGRGRLWRPWTPTSRSTRVRNPPPSPHHWWGGGREAHPWDMVLSSPGQGASQIN